MEVYIHLKLNSDVKNNFIFPMTSPGKLNEVEQEITKKMTKLTIGKGWHLLLQDQGQCKHKRLTSTSMRMVSTIRKGVVDVGVCRMKVWSFKS